MNPGIVSPPTLEADAPTHLLTLLTDAVRLRLRADVPVGTCLSGGIDSSTIVALIARLLATEHPDSVGERQRTFSAVYTDSRFDERAFMEVAAESAGVAGAYIEPDPERLRDDLLDLVWAQDEPFGSLSIYAQYCVMRLAAESVTVVLDGQGADEQLAGYLAVPGYRTLLLLSAAAGSGGSSRRRSVPSDTTAASSRTRRDSFVIRRGRRGLLRIDAPPVHRYAGDLDHVLRQETVVTNLPALLHYEDRNSMHFSIEARVPFLDYRVVESLASLPLDQKLRRGVTKLVLRRAIRKLVPEAIRCRMDKMGFVTPEEVWMGGDSVRSWMRSSPRRRSAHARTGTPRRSRRTSPGIEPAAGYSQEVFRIFVTNSGSASSSTFARRPSVSGPPEGNEKGSVLTQRTPIIFIHSLRGSCSLRPRSGSPV